MNQTFEFSKLILLFKVSLSIICYFAQSPSEIVEISGPESSAGHQAPEQSWEAREETLVVKEIIEVVIDLAELSLAGDVVSEERLLVPIRVRFRVVVV